MFSDATTLRPAASMIRANMALPLSPPALTIGRLARRAVADIVFLTPGIKTCAARSKRPDNHLLQDCPGLEHLVLHSCILYVASLCYVVRYMTKCSQKIDYKW